MAKVSFGTDLIPMSHLSRSSRVSSFCTAGFGCLLGMLSPASIRSLKAALKKKYPILGRGLSSAGSVGFGGGAAGTVGRFLTDLSPVRTHSHRTVGMAIGISVTFLIPHASFVANLLPSVTITFTASGSYLGTSVPPCLRIWEGRMSDRG
jgi:hypothetical protein